MAAGFDLSFVLISASYLHISRYFLLRRQSPSISFTVRLRIYAPLPRRVRAACETSNAA